MREKGGKRREEKKRGKRRRTRGKKGRREEKEGVKKLDNHVRKEERGKKNPSNPFSSLEVLMILIG